MEKALIVFSGGQDSTTCLGWALNKFNYVETITFDYGQKHIDPSLNIQEFMHKNLVCFDTEDLLYDVVNKMRKENIRRAVIYDRIKKDYFTITSKDILRAPLKISQYS